MMMSRSTCPRSSSSDLSNTSSSFSPKNVMSGWVAVDQDASALVPMTRNPDNRGSTSTELIHLHDTGWV